MPCVFAVKYAYLETVDLLIQHGIDVRHRDQFGRTCLLNALEHPNPLIIRRLLEYLPATETIPAESEDGTLVVQKSLVDALLDFVVSQSPVISWVNLGTPRDEDIIVALLLLRQRGVKLTFVGTGFSIALLGRACLAPEKSQI